MATQHNFEHLPLLLRYQGTACLSGRGKSSPQTRANRNARAAHSESLRNAAQSVSAHWQEVLSQRQEQALPAISKGIPVLLQVDPGLDLDVLREKFDFEIVAEQEEGYVIVASEDIELRPFLKMVNEFAVEVHGSATVASIHNLLDSPDQVDRLRRILAPSLFEHWGSVCDNSDYIVDIGIACVGTGEIPPTPVRGKRDSDADWARKEAEWSQARSDAYTTWDDIKSSREDEITNWVSHYHAEILSCIDGAPFTAAVLPDSFTVRLRIIGKGLKDFVLNYAYIFEVVEPEDIILPQRTQDTAAQPGPVASPIAPDSTAPFVCIIDSGIQEGHTLLQAAIDSSTSYCFVSGKSTTDVADYVGPGGHGTRVAGAVLYGETVPKEGTPQLPFWIQNARVLDEEARMTLEMLPATVIRRVIEQFHHGPRNTRIFNHSINSKRVLPHPLHVFLGS